MIKYALDTNIVSYIIKDNRKVIANFDAESAKGNQCFIPGVVYYEIKRGLLKANATRKIAIFDDLCKWLTVVEMNLVAWDTAALIYKELYQGRTIDDADIFIAATCIAHNATLVTNNTRHFARINNLKITNWA